MFIDATYEGDLMAAAGVDYHVGREAQERLRREVERRADRRAASPPSFRRAVKRRSALTLIPGDPKSGVLPRISTAPPGEYGAGRQAGAGLLLPHVPDRSSRQPRPIPQTGRLRPEAVRIAAAHLRGRLARDVSESSIRIPNHKTDTNNHGPFSTDNIGYNYDYPEASYERRREIIAEHETYQKGWLYFIANDPRVPEDVQKEMRRWGLREG